MDGFIYLDLRNCRHLKHSTQQFIQLKCHQLGVNMSTRTWDPSLWTSFLNYFSLEANTCTWELGFLYDITIAVSTHTRGFGLWLYIITTRTTLLEGGWSVGILPRGVIGAYGPISDKNRISIVAI